MPQFFRDFQGFLPLTILALVASCFSIHRTLDEAVFYDGPYFKLKLERRYDRQYAILIDEVFNTFVVRCSSPATRTGRKQRWVDVGQGNAAGLRRAEDLVERESSKYRVIDERTMVYVEYAVAVTFDGCGTFAHWGPTSLPADAVDPAPKPEWCSQPKVDCRGYDFMNDRLPRFEDVRVERDGKISFVVRSKAFRNGTAFNVRSDDYGRTWNVSLFDGTT